MGQEIPLWFPPSGRGLRPQPSYRLVKFSYNSTTIDMKIQCIVLCALGGLRGMHESCWVTVSSFGTIFFTLTLSAITQGQLPGCSAPHSTRGCQLQAHGSFGTFLLRHCASITAQNSLWTSLLKDLELQAAEGLKHLSFLSSHWSRNFLKCLCRTRHLNSETSHEI